MNTFDDLLGGDEPHATFHGATVLAIHVDYVARRLVLNLEIPLDDPAAHTSHTGRSRTGQLIVEGLRLWALEPPDRTHRMRKGLLLKEATPLSDTDTVAAETLRVTIGRVNFGWALFFGDLNAYGYMAGERAHFAWTPAPIG